MSSLSLSWLERDKDTDLNLFIEGKQRNGKKRSISWCVVLSSSFSSHYFLGCVCAIEWGSQFYVFVCVSLKRQRDKKTGADDGMR